MTDEKRQPVGYVIATVKFPLYEGDNNAPLNSDKGFAPEDFPWFEFRKPGITDKHTIGLCIRKCETLSVSVDQA